MRKTTDDPGRAFTLIELLVVVAIVALLVSLIVPALGSAKAQAKKTVCASNLRQLAVGAIMYATDGRGAMPPCSWWSRGVTAYWWGQVKVETNQVDHTVSPIYKYLRTGLGEDSVFECPEQPWGTYRPQPMDLKEQVTSTYGYNGYYLTPAATTGWWHQIRDRPWQKLESIQMPGLVFMFADALIVDPNNPTGLPANIALLDPPYIYSGNGGMFRATLGSASVSDVWEENGFPTTSFRHRGQTNAASCDGHVESYDLEGGKMTSPKHMIGSVGVNNGPHYVPDWRDW